MRYIDVSLRKADEFLCRRKGAKKQSNLGKEGINAEQRRAKEMLRVNTSDDVAMNVEQAL